MNKAKSQGYWGGRIRYNLIFNILIIALIVVPFFIPAYATLGIIYFFSASWVLFTFNYLLVSHRLKKFNQNRKNNSINCEQKKNGDDDVEGPAKNPNQDQELNNSDTITQNEDRLRFIMMTFIYKEPIELLVETLNNISLMKRSSELIVIIGFEERTPNKEEKIQKIQEKFKNNFDQLYIAIHPYGVENEIPGKCSNANYTQRKIVEYLQALDENFNPEKYFMTNFDTDTRFQSDYIEVFENAIKNTKPENRNKIIWQPILFYNWKLDESSIFVRITSLIRNMLMMGVLISLQLNVMSIFGFSLDLCIKGGFTHPSYQMEDIICYIRWIVKTGVIAKIEPLYSPTLSGPTSGANYWDEISEWARQLRRWTIGSAEVFHYFLVKSRKMKFKFRLVYWAMSYTNYYCLFLIGQNILLVSNAIAYNLIQKTNDPFMIWLQLIPLGIQYLSILVMFIENHRSLYMIQDIAGREKIGFLTNIIHFILAPLILFLYGCVAFYALNEIAIRGKKVCKHGASKKDGLENKI